MTVRITAIYHPCGNAIWKKARWQFRGGYQKGIRVMGRKTGEKIKNLCIFALPGCLIFCAVVILPFLYGFYLTLTDWDGVSKVKNIVGVQNYISVFILVLYGTHFKICTFIGNLSQCSGIPFSICTDKRNQRPEIFPCRFLYTKFDRWCRTWIYLAVRIFKSACKHGKEHGLGIIFHFLVSRSE